MARGQCPSMLNLEFGAANVVGNRITVPINLNTNNASIEIIRSQFRITISNSIGVAVDSDMTTGSINPALQNETNFNDPLDFPVEFGYNFYSTPILLAPGGDGIIHLFELTFTGAAGECYVLEFDFDFPEQFIFPPFPTGPRCVATTNEGVDHPFNLEVCIPAAELSGQITKLPQGLGSGCNGSFDFGIPDVRIDIADETIPTNLISVCETDTEPNGKYSCVVGLNGSYQVEASREGHQDCGLNELDLQAMARHILEVDEFTEMWEWIAADMDNSGTITAGIDMVELRHILTTPGHQTQFPIWDFIPTDTYIARSQLATAFWLNYDPLLHTGPIVVPQQGFFHSFFGIKAGDVTGNCTDCGLMGNKAEDRSYEKIEAYIDTYPYFDDRTMIVEVKANEGFFYHHLKGIFSKNNSGFKFIDAIENGLNNDLISYTNHSALTIDQMSIGMKEPVRVDRNQTLFKFTVESANIENFKKEFINLERSNIIDDKGELFELIIIDRSIVESNQLINFTPNPFVNSVQFSINEIMDNDYPIEVTFYDTLGKLIDQRTFSGGNELISTKDWPTGLILYTYKDSSGNLQSGKLLHQ